MERREFVQQGALLAGGVGLAYFSDLGSHVAAQAPAAGPDKPVHTKRVLKIEPVTPESFKPFGVILTDIGRERLPINTYGDKLDLYHDKFESDQPVEWFIVKARPRWNGVLFLERHKQITQTFIPIGGVGFLTVMAPPNCKEENGFPALSELKAFFIPGDTPIQIHRETWHENPMPLTEQRLLVTAHTALIKGHIKGGYNKALDAYPLDLERRWYKKEGYDISLEY